MASGQQTTLRGWKEIATYVGRDVRTVQRWEARRGFPVSRLPGGDRGNVYALTAEVDAWLHPSSRVRVAEASAGAADPADQAAQEAAAGSRWEPPLNVAPAVAADMVARRHESSVWMVLYSGRITRVSLGFLAVALAVAALVFFRFHQEHVQAGGTLEHVRGAERAAAQGSAANQTYLQGMYLFEQRTPDSLREAKHALIEVTAEDPDSAPAWAGLAEVATLLYEYGVETDAGAPARAREFARRALALDPGLAEPHAVLGFADFFWHGDVRAAEPEFQEALRINPMSALTRSWYGAVLTFEARYPEALEQLNRAQMLDPSSTAILSNRALALGLSGHRDEAVRLLEKAGGDHAIASVRFHLALLALVKPSEPAAYLREELALAQVTHDAAARRLYSAAEGAFQRGGEPAMWRAMIAYAEHAPVPPDLLAGAHAALGETDAAMEVLTRMEKDQGPIVSVSMHPLLLPLHSDPRFLHFLAAQRLPPVTE